MDKQNVICTHSGILFSPKHGAILTHATTRVNPRTLCHGEETSHIKANADLTQSAQSSPHPRKYKGERQGLGRGVDLGAVFQWRWNFSFKRKRKQEYGNERWCDGGTNAEYV